VEVVLQIYIKEFNIQLFSAKKNPQPRLVKGFRNRVFFEIAANIVILFGLQKKY
jgi:hypothetical protein